LLSLDVGVLGYPFEFAEVLKMPKVGTIDLETMFGHQLYGGGCDGSFCNGEAA
jgi:hypothetical protein